MTPRVLAVVHAVGVALLAVLAVSTLRTRCEGFGCMGLGVLWMAWAVAGLTWLAGGALLWRRVRRSGGSTGVIRASLAVQLAGMLALAMVALLNRMD